MKPYILLTPGPTPLPPQVLEALSRPILHHRTQEFGEIFGRVLSDMQKVFRTKNTVLMITSSGTGAMESAVANLLSPGDKALVHSTGAFGNRFAKILKAYGIEPMIIYEEWGEAAQPARLKAVLAAQKDFKVVFFQHTDTSTGVLNDIETLARTVRENSDALVVVDSVSGLAAERLETDGWGVDVAITGSQKGLMNCPGLAFAAVSDRAWKAVETAKLPRFYFDWRSIKKSLPDLETPFTPAVSLVVAQAEALKLILQEGMEKVWKRTADLAEHTRAEVQKMGLRLFPKDPAHILTAAWLPEGMDGNALLKALRKEERISIANGQEKLKGKIVRIAHMGYISRQDVDAGLSALARRLKPVHA